MGLFDKFKKEKTGADWSTAYKANPQFYSKPNGTPFCAFALTEGTDTILPLAPHYAVEGNEITDYRLVLVSTTKDGIVGDCEYFTAMKKLDAFKLDSNADTLLVRGLSLDELAGITE
jgi:hypothetical protein